ncbi:Testis, prostate and placenta-expressed protein [Manis javanica]|nr:Testis, prostate and placenta-expressed protein [Manis javanica]
MYVHKPVDNTTKWHPPLPWQIYRMRTRTWLRHKISSHKDLKQDCLELNHASSIYQLRECRDDKTETWRELLAQAHIACVSIGVYVQDRLLSLCLSPKGLKRKAYIPQCIPARA